MAHELTEHDMHEMYVLNIFMAACCLDTYQIRELGNRLLAMPGLQDVTDLIRRTFDLTTEDTE